MDFQRSEEQRAVGELATQVVGGLVDPDRLATLDADDVRVDAHLWSELVAAGLVGVALPRDLGGAGLGMVELGLLLEVVGTHVARVPLWSAVLGAGVLAAHGDDDQRGWAAATVAGTGRVAVALEEFGHHDPRHPGTAATPTGGDWRLTGTKAAVVDLPGADRVVISATTPEGPALFLVDPADDGVRLEPVDTTAYAPAANLVLDDAAARPVGAGADTVTWLHDRVQVALAWLQVGVAGGATARAVTYLADREQFGRPLGTFQAVAHRIADCQVRVRAMRATALQAAWRLDDGDAGTSVLVAAWWAADAGQQVVHDVMHLHGGMGVDLDHPIHRYLLLGRDVADTLGGPSRTLARLGDQLHQLPGVPA